MPLEPSRLIILPSDRPAPRGSDPNHPTVGTAGPPSAPASTYVLLYNPARMSWPDRAAALLATRDGKPVRRHWSTGIRRRGIRPGDTALLIRVGQPHRGLIGVGSFTTPCLPDPDWSGQGRAPTMAQISLRELVADADLIPLDVLATEAPWSGWLYLQGSGVRVPPPVAKEALVLWRRWHPTPRPMTSPDMRPELPIRG